MRRGVALATNLEVLGRVSAQLRLSVDEAARLLEASTLRNSDVENVLDQYRNIGLTQKSICSLLTRQPSLLSGDGLESIKDLLAAFDALEMGRKTSGALLANQPFSLRQSCVDAIKQRLEFLSKTLSNVPIASILARNPSLLSLSVDDSLKPFFEHMAHSGLSVHEISHMLQKQPTVLSLDLRQNVIPVMAMLKSIFHDTWKKALVHSPEILSHPPTQLRTMFDAILKFTGVKPNWNETYLANVLKKCPMVLTVDPENIAIISEFVKTRFRWQPSNIRHLIRKFPEILMFESEDALHDTFSYLMSGVEIRGRVMKKHIRRSPMLLLLNPERDIKPRLEFLSSLDVETLMCNFCPMLMCSDEVFAVSHAKVHPQDFKSYLLRKQKKFSITGGDLD